MNIITYTANVIEILAPEIEYDKTSKEWKPRTEKEGFFTKEEVYRLIKKAMLFKKLPSSPYYIKRIELLLRLILSSKTHEAKKKSPVLDRQPYSS